MKKLHRLSHRLRSAAIDLHTEVVDEGDSRASWTALLQVYNALRKYAKAARKAKMHGVHDEAKALRRGVYEP